MENKAVSEIVKAEVNKVLEHLESEYKIILSEVSYLPYGVKYEVKSKKLDRSIGILIIYYGKRGFKLTREKFIYEEKKVFYIFSVFMIFFKYMMSSLISFIVDIGLYKIIFEIFKNIAGIYVIAISTIGARIVSSFVNYKINKNTVFRTSNKSSIIKYYILCIIQMLVSAGGVSYVYNLVGEKNEILIKIIVDIILFFVNFKIQKEWVFRREKNK